MIDLAAAQQVLKTTFGYDEFRPGQKAVIEQVLAGENTLAIMPTGGGKSLCYQIQRYFFRADRRCLTIDFFNERSGRRVK